MLGCHWGYQKHTSAEHGIVPSVPPAFILHARDDRTAPFTEAEAMAADFATAKVTVRFEIYDSGDHMGFNFPKPKNADWPTRFRHWLAEMLP